MIKKALLLAIPLAFSGLTHAANFPDGTWTKSCDLKSTVYSGNTLTSVCKNKQGDKISTSIIDVPKTCSRVYEKDNYEITNQNGQLRCGLYAYGMYQDSDKANDYSHSCYDIQVTATEVSAVCYDNKGNPQATHYDLSLSDDVGKWFWNDDYLVNDNGVLKKHHDFHPM